MLTRLRQPCRPCLLLGMAFQAGRQQQASHYRLTSLFCWPPPPLLLKSRQLVMAEKLPSCSSVRKEIVSPGALVECVCGNNPLASHRRPFREGINVTRAIGRPDGWEMNWWHRRQSGSVWKQHQDGTLTLGPFTVPPGVAPHLKLPTRNQPRFGALKLQSTAGGRVEHLVSWEPVLSYTDL